MTKRTTARGPLRNATKLLEAPPPENLATHATAATTDTGGGRGFMEEVEGFYVNGVAALAEVAGELNAFTVAAFLRDSGEFAECRPGQGSEGAFLVSEAFTLAIWGELSRCVPGVSLKTASRLVPRSLDVYGLYRNGTTRLSLSLDPKRPGQPSRDGETAALVLDLSSIWHKFYPRFRRYVVKQDPNMRGALALFKARVKDLREAIEAGLSPA